MDSELFHRKADRVLRTALHELTSLDWHVIRTLGEVLSIGQAHERLERVRAESDALEFIMATKSGNPSVRDWRKDDPVDHPKVSAKDLLISMAKRPRGHAQLAEGAGEVTVQPEEHVPELLGYRQFLEDFGVLP